MSMLCVDKDIKAAVFDVDGTLYDYRNGCVPHSAIDAVARLKEKGYFIIVATGRTMAIDVYKRQPLQHTGDGTGKRH